jgi:hypothetical protein
MLKKKGSVQQYRRDGAVAVFHFQITVNKNP